MNTLTDFYRNKDWRDLRARLMLERVDTKGNLHCEYCNKPIVKANQCVGHHKIPLTLSNFCDWNISLNPDNISLVHLSCHNEIHERWQGKWTKKVYLVYGAPCSGKSTFVKNNMKRGDLVVDMDAIWQSLTLGDKYDKPCSLLQAVFAVKSALYQCIKMRTGDWHTAWVISGAPRQRDRTTIEQQLDAESLYIDSTKLECMSRLQQDKERAMVQKEWTRYIDEWFEDYEPEK